MAVSFNASRLFVTLERQFPLSSQAGLNMAGALGIPGGSSGDESGLPGSLEFKVRGEIGPPWAQERHRRPEFSFEAYLKVCTGRAEEASRRERVRILKQDCS